MSTSSRGSGNRFKMMSSALGTVLVLALLSLAQLPTPSTAQKFSLDSSLDRTFRTAAYVQRENYNRKLFGFGRTYSSDFSEFSKISGKNIQEKDIAAIFRGVAYGLTESSDVTTTSTTPPPPPSTTTTPRTTTMFSYRRTTPRVPFINDNANQASETLKVVSANADPETNEISREESDSRNGILNYFVEDGDSDENFHESSHSGRREFYPEIISSIEPSTESGRTSNKKYVVSQNGDRQSIDVHVYLIGILMGLVALASLCCLCRIHSCTQLIPRGHYVTLQLLILLAAALRCIILFHDPYGLNGKLPRALISLLLNTVPPILSTTFALMLLVLLRAAKFFILPAFLQSPLVLAVVGGFHICFSIMVDISNGVLEYPDSSRPLEAGVQCVTAGWDTLLVIGYCIILYQAFIRSTKRHVLLPQYTCAVVAIAVVIKALLIVFMLYHIFDQGFDSHVVGNTRTWSWWVMVSCERLLEIFLCLSLLTAAATLTMKQTVASTNEQKVFSVISGYDQSTKFNTTGRRSPGNKNFMATNYALASTLQKKGSTMNSRSPKIFSGNQNVYDSSCEFKIQWNTPNQPDICSRAPEAQDNYQYKVSDQNEGHCEKTNFGTLKQNQSLFSQTLPPPRYYCAPVPVIEHEAPVVGRVAPYTLRPQKTPNIYCEIEDPTYEQESAYYTKPVPSTSSDIYSSPHYVASSYTQSHSTDHLYELPGVHQTSTPVEHGSNNYKSECQYQQNALPMGQRGNLPRCDTGQESSYSLMLPLYPNPCPPSRTVSHQRFNNTQLDTSPDSAIVLDYSSHSELEDHNHYNLHSQHTLKDIQEHQQQQDPSKRLDFMKLSTHSLNDVFKHNGGLLSKLVGSGGANTGYQPLNVEDTISSNSKPNQFNNMSVAGVADNEESDKHSNLSSQKSNNQNTTIRKMPNSPTSGEDLAGPVSSPLLLSGCPSPVTSL